MCNTIISLGDPLPANSSQWFRHWIMVTKSGVSVYPYSTAMSPRSECECGKHRNCIVEAAVLQLLTFRGLLDNSSYTGRHGLLLVDASRFYLMFCSSCKTMSAMVLEKKFAWKQLAPCLDPFTIAAASMTNRTVRSWCVSQCGLLIVPFVCVDCEDSAADQMIIMIKSLPAIDRSEVIELAIREGIGEAQNPDFFTLCLGWLLGPFVKLKKLDLSAWRGDWDSTLWMTVLRNLQRHSVALDSLKLLRLPSTST